MKRTGLQVGDGLSFPVDAITQSIALLAVRRAGKSNAAAVIAEEMYRAGLPWVAIDPKGDWWGLRSSADGTGPGLPIPIFGGLHGDMPLMPEAGHLIAELIAEENLTCVLDVSEFASKAAQMRFLTDLGERLFRLHGKHPQPRHIFLEEADDFLPQRVTANQARCVGAWTKLVKQGGSRGLGVSIISQRSAVVNKDALTQTETMIALRTTSPQDRKAILEWVSYHAVGRELVDSLPGLDDGEAWVCSPHWLGKHGQPPIQRVRFRRRETFDSGATPTVAKQRRPATLADIDLGALGNRMAAVVEKAANDDPAALRRRITALERQLASAPAPSAELNRLNAENRDLRTQLAAAEQRPAERIEVPVFAEGDIRAMEIAVTLMKDAAAKVADAVMLARAAEVPQPAGPEPDRIPAPETAWPRTEPGPGGWPVPAPGEPKVPGDLERAERTVPPLKAGARNMLAVLARQHPLKTTRSQLAALTRIKVRGSTFSTYIGQLRRAGLITEQGGYVIPTADGLAAAGTTAHEPFGPDEIREMWDSVLKAGARAMLGTLIGCYPGTVTRDELAAVLGIDVAGSTFSTYLGTLRRNGLAEETGDGIRAADVFFLGGTDG